MLPTPFSDGRPGDDDPTPLDERDETVPEVLFETLAYAREREYVGWDYCDGMSSRLRRWLPVEHDWLNLAIQETAKRFPVNVRPLLLVEQRRNFVGAGLFAMANLTARRLADREAPADAGVDAPAGVDPPADASVDAPAGVGFAEEARFLLDWLVRNRCRGYGGFCGSHQHRIQTLSGTGETTMPSVVSTAYPARALLRAGHLDPVYPAVARTAADFVVEDLDYREVPAGATIKYLPKDTGEYLTPNAMAIGARLLVDVYDRFGGEALATRATRILDYVAGLQAPDGGWTYRHPPETSHLSKDNFHNGFVLEAFLRYRDVVDGGRYDDVVDRALSFHRNVLFEASGAPNWDESSSYPRDVHAAAQGILVFAYAGDRDRAADVLAWTLDHLYAGGGRFYFRAHRLYTNRTTLMRWCEAWMAFAMAEYLSVRGGTPDRPTTRGDPGRPADAGVGE